ncbi:MAG: glycosyltransferase family 2 protein [Bacteriovoracaceae bacterium]|nr:glycosyltransferase family 2 protein [Bacteriovoracaceae bacterium]
MDQDSVIIVIPVYNEEECIQKVIEDWSSELSLKKVNFKLLLVNDGSTDQTGQILDNLSQTNSRLSIIHQENLGHGSAVKNGYIMAVSQDCDFVFQTDSDDQFTPQDFIKLWELRNTSPAVFGHRMHRYDPTHRKFISFFLKKFIFNLFQVNIPDANIPYRLFNRSFLSHLLATLTPGLFAPNVFLSILSFKSLGSCPVVPVSHFERKGTEAKLIRWGLIKACFKSFWDVLTFSYQLNQKLLYIRESQDIIKLKSIANNPKVTALAA